MSDGKRRMRKGGGRGLEKLIESGVCRLIYVLHTDGSRGVRS